MRGARGRCARILERRGNTGRFGIGAQVLQAGARKMRATANWERDELARAEALAMQLRGSERYARIFAVRAPGRVNLIGEHTDYSGLPVMPIAIDRSTIVVVAPRDDAIVKLRNLDPHFPA